MEECSCLPSVAWFLDGLCRPLVEKEPIRIILWSGFLEELIELESSVVDEFEKVSDVRRSKPGRGKCRRHDFCAALTELRLQLFESRTDVFRLLIAVTNSSLEWC